jgi:hypothetical protein
VIIHEELGVIVPLVRVIVVPPLTAVREAEAPHPDKFGETGLARKTPAGRVSVNETWVKLLPGSLFAIIIESWLVCPARIVPGLKLLVMLGAGLPETFNVALAGVVFVMLTPPPVELNAPAGMVLMRLPVVVAVILIDTVHEPGVGPDCAGTVPPLSDTVVPPAAALTEPPQELVTPTGLAMIRPGWTRSKSSSQEAFVSGKPLGLKMVTLKREVPPAGIEIGEKLLLISAGREIWAYTVCPGTARLETINTTARRDRNGLRIFCPLNVEHDLLKNKRNRPSAVGFAICSPLPIPVIWIGDQSGLWINASAVTNY